MYLDGKEEKKTLKSQSSTKKNNCRFQLEISKQISIFISKINCLLRNNLRKIKTDDEATQSANEVKEKIEAKAKKVTKQ